MESPQLDLFYEKHASYRKDKVSKSHKKVKL